MTDTDAPGDQRLSAFADQSARRQAISVRASCQCRHDALSVVSCRAGHYHLLENEEVRSARESLGAPC